MSSQPCPSSPPPGGYWNRVARQWRQVGPPLRPCEEDLAFLREALRRHRAAPIPRVLVLGATAEFHDLPWPPGTSLLAADKSQDMLEAVWPGPPATACRTDWLNLPPAVGKRDVILCDGSLSLVEYPGQLQRLVHVLLRCTAPDALCLFRLYVHPAVQETAEQVLRELSQEKIPNLSALKLRLWTALERDGQGVKLADVWEAAHHLAPEGMALARHIGWPAEQRAALDAYRHCADRYYFPSVAQVRGAFCASPGGFECPEVHVPAYALGDRCPTLVLRRR
jgi:hypothetical protein